jgi:hypothetical protein
MLTPSLEPEVFCFSFNHLFFMAELGRQIMRDICRDLGCRELLLLVLWVVLVLLYKGFLSLFCLIDRVLGQRLEGLIVDEDFSIEGPISKLLVLIALNGDHVKSRKEVSVSCVLCTGNDRR